MKRTSKKFKKFKSDVGFVLKIIFYILFLAIFAPGILSMFVGAAIGCTFYGMVAYVMDKYDLW